MQRQHLEDDDDDDEAAEDAELAERRRAAPPNIFVMSLKWKPRFAVVEFGGHADAFWVAEVMLRMSASGVAWSAGMQSVTRPSKTV